MFLYSSAFSSGMLIKALEEIPVNALSPIFSICPDLITIVPNSLDL